MMAANIECWLGFQGFWNNFVKKPYIFVIFQGGSGPPDSPSGSARAVRTLSGKSLVVIGVLRNTGTDWVQFLLNGGSFCPL